MTHLSPEFVQIVWIMALGFLTFLGVVLALIVITWVKFIRNLTPPPTETPSVYYEPPSWNIKHKD